MIELNKIFPSQKERRLRKEGRRVKPILPIRFKYLLEKGAKSVSLKIAKEAYNLYLKGEIELLGFGKLSKDEIGRIRKRRYQEFEREIPYVFSRLGWLVLPSINYHFFPSDKAYSLIKKDILDWITRNPPLRGIGWEKLEDISIRAATIPLIYDALSNESLGDRKLTEKLSASLVEHYLYLEDFNGLKGLERMLLLTGLLHSSVFLRKFSIPTPNFDPAMEDFLSAIYDELDKDGFFKGASIEDHLIFFELSLFTATLLQKNKYLFGEAWERMERAASIIYELRTDDGLPRIGEEKNFYLFPIYSLNRRADFLLSLFCSIYPHTAKNFPSLDDVSIFTKPIKGSVKKKGLCMKEAGIAALHNENKMIVLSCMKTAENDNLSIILAVDEKEIITDPGTYSKEGQYSERMRSTLYHSTLMIGGKEQPSGKKAKMLSCKKTETEGEFLWGEGIVHRRRVTREENGFSIEDEVISQKDVELAWSFVLHPGVRLGFEEGISLERGSSKVVLKYPEGVRIEVDKIQYSPVYGEMAKTRRIILKKRGRGKFKFSIV